MSYFSHNPEAWDEIEQRGVATKLAGMTTFASPQLQEEFIESLTHILSELQIDREDKASKAWSALCDLAHEEIINSERHYWDRFVP